MRLAEQDPSNASWQRDLSISYDRVGDARSAQGDLGGALESYEHSLALAMRLAEQDPSNASWQRDLSVSLGKIGGVRSARGDLAGALKSYLDALAIAQELAQRDPSNADWQLDLAVSYCQSGTTLARSDPQSKKDARRFMEKGRDILRRIKTRTGLTSVHQGWLDLIEANLRKL
jgi:Flp pilus assembly protein TadD